MKFIKKKLIKGHEYYYFEYSLKIADKRYTYTKYLGSELPENLKELILHYFHEIAIFVINKLNHSKYFPGNGFKTIEISKFSYRSLNHELFRREFVLFKTLYYVLFVLNSNRAEGSKVTRPNIEEIMKKRIKPTTIVEKEIINSINAINFSFSRNMNWNEKSIKKIHEFLFFNIHPEIAGKYKKTNIVVGNEETTHWKNVKKEIQSLLLWFKKNKKITYPPQLALEFHWRFEAIHPFEDGNGRVGRILLNAILLEQGYAPVVFFSENHQAYCNSISKARKGYPLPLAKHFVKSIEKTAKAIAKYKEEGIIKGGSTKIGKWELQKGKIRVK